VALLAIVVLVLGCAVRWRALELMRHVRRVVSPAPLTVDFHSTAPVARYDWLSAHLDEGDVVMADPGLCYHLPALTGCRVVASAHREQFGVDHRQRHAGVDRLLHNRLSDEQLETIIAKYHATHVLLDDRNSTPEVKAQLRRLCDEVGSSQGLRLYATGRK